MKKIQTHLILYSSFLLLIVGSSCSNEYRYEQLNKDFNASEFNGRVTAVAQDRADHNAWKIFYGTSNELDLTWFDNREELITEIKPGDFLIKEKGRKYIIVQSDESDKKIYARFIR